ncbi:MAG TPA: hypothetical protein VM537_32245, partial [Anaerolineae bacterium]|nr:hypothetical protein [Anaerolineae bacterium]
MKIRRRVVLVLGLVAVASLLVGALAAAQNPVPSPAEPATEVAEAQSIMALPPTSTRPGIYMAFPGWDGEDPALYGHEGELRFYNWSDLEGAQGDYNMATIRNWVERKHQQGKKAAFGISAYNGRADGGIAIPAYLRNDPDAVVDVGGGWLIPKYWSDTYLRAYGALVYKIASSFRGDPRIEF